MLKKILPWIVFVGLFGLIIIGFALKDNMNDYVSTMMKTQAGSEIAKSGSAYVASTFNYTLVLRQSQHRFYWTRTEKSFSGIRDIFRLMI